jgi:hypothetical protein
VQLWQANGAPQQNWFVMPQAGTLTANPSTLAVPDGVAATTTLRWSAPGPGAQVWMSVDGRPATLLAAQAGTQPVTIPPGTTTFTLSYGVDPTEHLGSLSVTASPAPGSPASVAAPCEAQPTGTATQLVATVASGPGLGAEEVTLPVYGQATVSGTLTNQFGAGVGGAIVCLADEDTTSGAPLELAASTATAAGGSFAFTVPPGPSRTMWVLTNGQTSVLSTTLASYVRGAVSVSARRSHLRNGHTLKLYGTLPGPVPARGALVLVQVWRGKYWETFKDVRTSSAGAYVAAYRFRSTYTRTTYRMRVAVPAQPGYPYLPSHSRSIPIHVRP